MLFYIFLSCWKLANEVATLSTSTNDLLNVMRVAYVTISMVKHLI